MGNSESQKIDYTEVINTFIQKQLVIVGPNLTFAKLKKINGLRTDQNGRVVSLEVARGQEILEEIVEEFLQVSEMIVEKTIEALLLTHPSLSFTNKRHAKILASVKSKQGGLLGVAGAMSAVQGSQSPLEKIIEQAVAAPTLESEKPGVTADPVAPVPQSQPASPVVAVPPQQEEKEVHKPLPHEEDEDTADVARIKQLFAE